MKEIKVVDYSKGKEYVYGDQSGSWTSIKAVDGEIMVGAQSGTGNAGQISQPASGGTIAGSSSFKAPTNSGLVSSTPTTKSKETSTATTSSTSGANTSEPARSTTSGSSASPSSGSAFSPSNGNVNKSPSQSTSPVVQNDPDSAAISIKAPAALLGGMVMVVGLVL